MFRVVALFVLIAPLAVTSQAFGNCDSFDAEKLNEGYCPHRYQDTKGIWTIGVGFNLQKGDARQQMTECGGNYHDVMNGPNSCHYSGNTSQLLPDSVTQCLLNKDIAYSRECGQRCIPGFSSLKSGAKSAFTDMAYNMGCGGACSFHHMIAMMQAGNWSGAVSGMKESRWCSQVGVRCRRDIACMQN
eukprot:NODE_7787_length_743_cov_32.338710_g7536_i0.p1 GENE.NODE_7787_length_743_cov_32.338710_g7536_i0~~NODE_7787_length_743_cov_32.338710_g7536_i0.p1  ORF type:complete len:204 (+),score=43.28 NODE_7787_length_743_cov_32.338710_g7536_i0:54-614(+)